jgi:hypothetical protein
MDKLQLREFIYTLRPMYTPSELRRFGPKGDGGYIMPDDLDGVGGCVSPGVSTECGFDVQIAELGIDVHLADASVSGPPVSHPKFTFSKLYVDTFDGVDTVTIDKFSRSISPGNDLILQMDIEGAEYRVLNSASDRLLSRFRIMVIEFHSLAALFTPFGFQEISSVFRKLLSTHNIVHIHPNNASTVISAGPIIIPQCMEFTFYRKDRSNFEYRSLRYPHPLDVKNVGDRRDIALPRCWCGPDA